MQVFLLATAVHPHCVAKLASFKLMRGLLFFRLHTYIKDMDRGKLQVTSRYKAKEVRPEADLLLSTTKTWKEDKTTGVYNKENQSHYSHV